MLAAVVQHVLNASRDARVLLVAHRTQLVEQLTDTVHRVLGGTAEGQALLQRVEIRSIQWLTRQASCLQQAPQLVVIDEAHHALAATYRILWQQWPGARFLGCTATPCRLNGEGFTDLWAAPPLPAGSTVKGLPTCSRCWCARTASGGL